MKKITTKEEKQAIKSLLKTKRGSFTRVAEQLGVTRPSITRWLNGGFPSHNFETAIPKAIRKLKLKRKPRSEAA